MITLEKVLPADIQRLATLASEIWHEYFPCILTAEQIDFMVENFQSATAIRQQLQQGYEYYFILSNALPIGYVGICKEGRALFLSKLYIKKQYRGLGASSTAFGFLDSLCRQNQMDQIYLHVNKYNEHSIAVYKHVGFEIESSEVTDIGMGFQMDDYVMRKYVSK